MPHARQLTAAGSYMATRPPPQTGSVLVLAGSLVYYYHYLRELGQSDDSETRALLFADPPEDFRPLH
jgi:hypothetical protein